MAMTSLAAKIQGFTGPDVPPRSVIDRCVQCGFCLPTCPTYILTGKEASSPRGRIHLLRAVSDGRLDAQAAVIRDQMYECLNCRACEAVCPSGVLYGQLVEPARAQVERHLERPKWQRLLRAVIFGHIFSNLRLFRLISAAIGFYQQSPLQKLARATGILKLLKLQDQEALLPPVSFPFIVPVGQRWPAYQTPRYQVGLFTGCIMSTAFARVDEATARVLARNGCEVVALRDQGCCGALAIHAGEIAIGRENARRNIAAFEKLDLDAIIVNAAGCGAALKEYGHLFHGDPVWATRAERFSSRVKDVSEFLDSIELEPPGHLERTVTYQEPCHLAHAQRITAAPRRLLQKIPGLTLVEMEESSLCCGSAGIYNITRPDISHQLLNRKLDSALKTGATTIVSANPGCMMQLAAGVRERKQPIRVQHIIDLLDEAYRA